MEKDLTKELILQQIWDTRCWIKDVLEKDYLGRGNDFAAYVQQEKMDMLDVLSYWIEHELPVEIEQAERMGQAKNP